MCCLLTSLVYFVTYTAIFPVHVSPVVIHEIDACCHHQISLKCSNKNSRLVILQARYYLKEKFEEETISSKQQFFSLKNLDIKFSEEAAIVDKEAHVNAPEWHPFHPKNKENVKNFFPLNIKLSVKPFSGLSVTKHGNSIEMPPYDKEFMDKETIWNEPLFLAPNKRLRQENNYNSVYSTSPGDLKCIAYTPLNRIPYVKGSEVSRPEWQFKDLRPFFNQRCSGKSYCNVYLMRNIRKDEELTRVCDQMPEGRIQVKYTCYNTLSVHSLCNTNVAPAGEGFIMNPGYPELYPGDRVCQWRLQVPQQKILLVLFDISIRGQAHMKCQDELRINESRQNLLRTCGDSSTAIALLSETDKVNVTLLVRSRLAFPKRGFLLYYRVIGCSNPVVPKASYMVFRNATHAHLLCDLGHIFDDTFSRQRWILCNPFDHKWIGGFSQCLDIRQYAGNTSLENIIFSDPTLWPLRTKKDIFGSFIRSQHFLPIVVLISLFTLNGIVLMVIQRRKSGMEELENETNQEMERLCITNDKEIDGSSTTFSMCSDVSSDLWNPQDLDDFDDHDPTMTTLTLHTDTPSSTPLINISQRLPKHGNTKDGHRSPSNTSILPAYHSSRLIDQDPSFFRFPRITSV